MIYYAHPVTWYDTPAEADDVARLERILGAPVLNPNGQDHQAGYDVRGMDYFFEDVLPQCSACVVRSFRDGMIGAGVWSEAAWFARRGMAVLETYAHGLMPFSFDERRRLSLDAGRVRVKAGVM